MGKIPEFADEALLAKRLKTPFAVEAYDKLNLGGQIKKLRQKAGMTQQALAMKLYTTQSVIARMEAGKQNFTLRTLIHIGFIFNKKLYFRFE